MNNAEINAARTRNDECCRGGDEVVCDRDGHVTCQGNVDGGDGDEEENDDAGRCCCMESDKSPELGQNQHTSYMAYGE